MLVITRKSEQGIFVGDDVFIKILDNSRGQVQVGIHAPKGVPVVREELVEETHPLYEMMVLGQMQRDMKRSHE